MFLFLRFRVLRKEKVKCITKIIYVNVRIDLDLDCVLVCVCICVLDIILSIMADALIGSCKMCV